jgi:hypothetical protein
MAHFSDTRYGLRVKVELAERDTGKDFVYLSFGDPNQDSRGWTHLALSREEAEIIGEKLIAASVRSMEREPHV